MTGTPLTDGPLVLIEGSLRAEAVFHEGTALQGEGSCEWQPSCERLDYIHSHSQKWPSLVCSPSNTMTALDRMFL